MIFKGVTTPQLSNVVFDVANFANAHLEKARSFKDKVPSAAIPAFYSSVSIKKK